MREGETARPPAGTAARALTAGAALLVGVGFLAHLRPWTFLCDDAFISFRYAHNLAEHGALTYNLPPHAPVEGYTNFLWVLLLALGELAGLAPERLAPLLTAGSALASLLLVALICAQLRRQLGPAARGEAPPASGDPRPAPFELVDLLGPALLAATPEFVVWGSGGLETCLALALALTAVWAWLDGRIELAALASAGAGLTRLDALAGVACFGLAWLVVRGVVLLRDRTDARSLAAIVRALPWRRVAVAALLFALPLLAQLLWRRSFYGEWLPNTWAVKRHGAALRPFFGRGYLEFWTASLGLTALAPLLLALRPRHLLLLAPIAAQLAWAWSVGGDFMAYGRFLLPATTLLALLIGLALAELRDELCARGWLGPRAASALWAALALLLIASACAKIPSRLAADRARAHLHVEGPDPKTTPGFESVDAMHRFAAVRLAAGHALREAVPPDTLITVGAAGAMPYASRLPTYDSYGLVDPGVVAVAKPLTREQGARPGHQLHAPLDYMLGHDPDLLCHVGYAGERLPPRGFDRRRGAGRGAAREWTGWACVETGAIPDPRAEGGELPSQWYCCMRPVDRFEALDEAPLRRRSP